MIKTEQELKDALEDIFFDALTDTSNPPYYTDKVDPENDGYWQCKVYELCADELIKRGYGDISEYKAEIIKQDQVIIERNFELVELEDKIKQAQIDVLKRLKVFSEPYPNSWGIYVIDVYHIDELIKEIEEQ